MTLHLPNLTNVPPGGWRYKVPETGQDFDGSNPDELLQRLQYHYKATGYEQPSDLARKIEDYICDQHPDYCGGQPRATKTNTFTAFANTFHMVLQGTRTLASWLVDGKERVEPKVANARGAVCVGCSENQEPQGCTSCNMGVLREAVRKIAGNRTTDHGDALKACRVCGCDLKAKVHLPHDVLWRNMPHAQKEKLPAHCWLIKERLDVLTQTEDSGGVTEFNPPPLS